MVLEGDEVIAVGAQVRHVRVVGGHQAGDWSAFVGGRDEDVGCASDQEDQNWLADLDQVSRKFGGNA